MNAMMRTVLFLFAILQWENSFAREKVNSETKQFTINWVLAHEPIDLFKEAAENFSEELVKLTDGKVKINIMTLNEYQKKHNSNKKISETAFLELLKTGKIQMSQTYTTHLGEVNPNMYVLDLPFLFRDHDHAQNVLEGSIGKGLLAGLSKSNIKGLAFTYSGGYRIVPAKKEISKLEDFQGLKVRIAKSPVAFDTFTMLGAKPIAMPLNKINEAMASGKIDAAESTLVRFYSLEQNSTSKFVNRTEHSLFLTSIIVNENFWKSLPTDIQTAMQSAAVKAARTERSKAVADGIKIVQKCKDDGIKVIEMEKDEVVKMKRVLSPLYLKYEKFFETNLISSIQKS